MARGPWKTASDDAVRRRMRRLSANDPTFAEAKRLVAEDNDTLGALQLLHRTGHLTEAHVDAHKRWLAEQDIDSLV